MRAPPPAHLAPYHMRVAWDDSAKFWLSLVQESLTQQNLSRLVRLRLGKQPIMIDGLASLPPTGAFTLAANHFAARATMGVSAAVLAAASQARPDLDGRAMVVVGERHRPPRQSVVPWRPLLRRANRAFYRRWQRVVIRVPFENDAPAITSLRRWRAVAPHHPVLVFPEARASLEFGTIRPGAGRWLNRLPVPTLPVGVWWYADRWHVRFGPPLRWSHRAELLDLQLGLAIADLLPTDLTSGWTELLEAWHAAHQEATPLSPNPHHISL